MDYVRSEILREDIAKESVYPRELVLGFSPRGCMGEIRQCVLLRASFDEKEQEEAKGEKNRKLTRFAVCSS